MSTSPTSFGVIIVNLGTPEQPTAASVRRYLAEFLADRRVVDLPRWLWLIILHGIILRIRPGRVAKLYQSVWLPEGSPLYHYSQSLAKVLEESLSERLQQQVPVELAMVYGKPDFVAAGRRFREQDINQLIILPLYPQYSATTTAAAFDALARQLKPCPDVPGLHLIKHYPTHPAYIGALANRIQAHWQQQGRGDKLLMSFHGIPARYHTQGDPYPEECRATASALATALHLNDSEWEVVFQSRFGREEWLQPYADQRVCALASDGITRLDVVCPGFAVDCLETLEEIQVELKATFLEHGGQSYQYIPCLNDDKEHADALAALIAEHLPSPPGLH